MSILQTKDMIVKFYKKVSNKDIRYSAKNVNDLAEKSEDVYSNSSDEITKSKAIAFYLRKIINYIRVLHLLAQMYLQEIFEPILMLNFLSITGVLY